MIAKIKVDRTIKELKYKIYFSKQRHEKNSLMAEKFLGDITDYLRENPSEKLKPLNPKKEQLRILYFILDSIEEGQLIHKYTKGEIVCREPFLVSSYEAGVDPFKNRFFDKYDILTNLYADLVLSWNIKHEFPYRFIFGGRVGEENVKIIEFLISKKKIETPEQLEKIIIKSEKKNVEQEFGVYNDGKRLIHRVKLLKGREIEVVWQYYFIGAFESESAKQEYWLYGSNDDNNQVSVGEKVGLFDLVPKKVDVKK